MGVNSLPKTVTRQRRGCDLNPGPSAPESSTLTTRLSSHPLGQYLSSLRWQRARRLTELFGASVVEYLLIGRVESDAAHHVADLGTVDQAVSTVPEVEQIKHLFHVCEQQRAVVVCTRDDNGSHFLTRDPRDPWPATHDYSRVMTRDYCSFQSGPLSGSALKIKHHHCHEIACSWNLVNLIMGQRVTSTDPWPTWPTQICWPIVISGPKTRGNEDDSRYLHVFLADRGDSFIIIIIIIITQRLTRPVSIVRMTNRRRRQLGSCHGLCLSVCVWRLCIDVARNLNESNRLRFWCKDCQKVGCFGSNGGTKLPTERETSFV